MKKTSKKILATMLALMMLLTLLPASALAADDESYDLNGITVQFGDPGYEPTWPESAMELRSSGDDTWDAVYTGVNSDTYYPDILSLYAKYGTEPDTDDVTLTSNSENIKFVTYDENGVEELHSTISYSTNLNYNSEKGELVPSNLFTVQLTGAGSITLVTDDGLDATIVFEAPKDEPVGGGETPSAVISYLPIGQYSNGKQWGTSEGKFVNGFSATGVSLGTLGGYIEFEFENGIQDNPADPYGVDFIVYGNAFTGNPEAGAVQVSADGENWYELAGSLYYDDNFRYVGNQGSDSRFINAYTGTLNNAKATYDLASDGIYVTLTDPAGAGIPKVRFTSAVGWWPRADEGYPMGTGPLPGGNAKVTFSDTQISYDGITAVPDSNSTPYYAFGYADVTPNGSSYGVAVNPYASNTTGGDGFDLAWAVDPATKMPVDLSAETIKYVRVYTAVLDNGSFNETSTEVCGIFTAQRGTASVGTTAAPTITAGGLDIDQWGVEPQKIGNVDFYDLSAYLYEGAEITAVGSADTHLYINSSTNGTWTIGANDDYIRVIAQDGTGNQAPYIAVIKVR